MSRLYGIPIVTSPAAAPGSVLIVADMAEFRARLDRASALMRRFADEGKKAFAGITHLADAVRRADEAEWQRDWYRAPEEAWWER